MTKFGKPLPGTVPAPIVTAPGAGAAAASGDLSQAAALITPTMKQVYSGHESEIRRLWRERNVKMCPQCGDAPYVDGTGCYACGLDWDPPNHRGKR